MARGFRGGPSKVRAVGRLIERDGDRCSYCGGTFATGERLRTIDHAVPLVEGGKNRLENLRLACFLCNRGKGSLTEAEYRASAGLAERRRLVDRRRGRILGEFLPKQAYHHPQLRWFGECRWACGACRLSSVAGTRSPAVVPCLRRSAWAAVGCSVGISIGSLVDAEPRHSVSN